MKNIKKLLSIVMVLAMVLALGVQALAAEGGQKIVIEGRQDLGSTYNAYRLLTAEYDRTDNEGTDNAKDVYVYHINKTYIAALNAGITAVEGAITVNGHEVTKPGTITEANANDLEGLVLEYLSGMNATQTRAFADAAFGVLKTMGPDASTVVSADDVKNGSATISPVEGGYYLVSEVLASDQGDYTAVSLVMLDTAGNPNAHVNVKEDVPHSDKDVLDGNDSEALIVEPGITNANWGDSADHDIGDTVYFKLTGTLPADMAGYETYKLVFHDKEGNGLKFDPDTVKVFHNDTQITAGYGVVYPVPEEGDDCTFEVVFEDVLDDPINANEGDTFTVIYGSVLQEENVVIGGDGNPNTMFMEYTNDTYNEGDGTGTTPPTTVVVFTYELDTNKIDADKQPLNGAAFALLKEVKGDHESTVTWDDLYENDVAAGAYIQKGEKWYQVINVIGPLAAGSDFDFKGIDDGNYVLVETVVPDGYNRAEDIYFTVVAKHSADGLTELTPMKDGQPLNADGGAFSVEMGEGKVLTDVINQSGIELPETGGIGTTIFYIVGAILVAGAVILLVTKRRVNGAEK